MAGSNKDETLRDDIKSAIDEVGKRQKATVPTLEVREDGIFANGKPIQTVEKPSQEVHADDKTIIVAIGGGMFCAGLFGFYEGHQVLGSIFGLGGLIVMAPISPFVRTHFRWSIGRFALWTVAVTTWLLLAANIGWVIWLHYQPPTSVAAGTQSTVSPSSPATQQRSLPADVAKIISLQSLLDAKNRDLEAAKKQVTGAQNDAADTRGKAAQEKAALQSQLTGKTADLGRANQNIESLKQDLAVARTPKIEPIAPQFIPTHVRLQFNAANVGPIEIDNANIHWSWTSVVERVGKFCSNTVYGPVCMQSNPQGNKDDTDQDTAILTLILDKPVPYKKITVNFNGASLKWGIAAQSDRHAVIKIWPKPANFVLEVNMTQ